jgi:dCMP deaminase
LRRAEAKTAARKPDRRVGWHAYFMNIARQVATRSTCDRKHVGAVIVRAKTILSTGYNGSIRGMPHCDDVGHDIDSGHCIATIHAEANAILQAAKNGVMIEGAEMYTTASPCWSCFKLIANAGITTIYYGEFYRDKKSLEVAGRLGIDLIDLSSKGAGARTSDAAGPAAKSAAPGKARGGCDWQGPED